MASKPLKRHEVLYKNLFDNLNDEQIVSRLRDGIIAVHHNSSRLLADVDVLYRSRRFNSASFLLATAVEEQAKIFILLDMACLDFEKHRVPLLKLCRAFYDHVYKWAYIKALKEPRLFDIATVERIWACETTKLWPSNPETGDPSFPHETCFYREMPLYVDFIEYDQQWHLPSGSSHNWVLEGVGDGVISILEETKLLNARISDSLSIGLLECKPLMILHEIFNRLFITPKTTTHDIESIFAKLACAFEKEGLIVRDDLVNTCIYRWPLYHFVTNS